MATVNGIVRALDGRPVIAGCRTLPPVDDDKPPTGTGDNGQRNKPKQSRQATANRFGVLNSFIDCSMGNLSRVELATWFVLFRDTRNGIAVTPEATTATTAAER